MFVWSQAHVCFSPFSSLRGNTKPPRPPPNKTHPKMVLAPDTKQRSDRNDTDTEYAQQIGDSQEHVELSIEWTDQNLGDNSTFNMRTSFHFHAKSTFFCVVKNIASESRPRIGFPNLYGSTLMRSLGSSCRGWCAVAPPRNTDWHMSENQSPQE